MSWAADLGPRDPLNWIGGPQSGGPQCLGPPIWDLGIRWIGQGLEVRHAYIKNGEN